MQQQIAGYLRDIETIRQRLAYADEVIVNYQKVWGGLQSGAAMSEVLTLGGIAEQTENVLKFRWMLQHLVDSVNIAFIIYNNVINELESDIEDGTIKREDL